MEGNFAGPGQSPAEGFKHAGAYLVSCRGRAENRLFFFKDLLLETDFMEMERVKPSIH